MPADKDKRDYEIGRGRPPKHTRFKSGQSGNPRGRPKKPKSLAAAVIRALGTKIKLRENGKERVVTGIEAVALRLVTDAIQGKASAQKLIIELARSEPPIPGVPAAGEPEDGVAALREKIDRMRERMLQAPASGEE
jgi:hypothetical protein